jgi:DNA repair protein RadC
MNVKLTKSQKIKLLNSTDIYSIMQQVLMRENKIDRNKEHFWTIGLDNANRILYVELISLGTTTSAPVEPMQVYRVAILKGAVQMVLVHNHPSGETKPSKEDISITDRLIQVGNIIGIKIIDHLIITEKTYNSFADTELLHKIEESTRYVPTYKMEEQLKKEAAELAVQKEKIKFAQQLKEDGFNIEKIIKLTGITAEEAKKLKAAKSTKK